MSMPIKEGTGQKRESSSTSLKLAVFHGICTTCNHARTCRGALNASRPVHFCDLFDDHVEPVLRQVPKPKTDAANSGGEE